MVRPDDSTPTHIVDTPAGPVRCGARKPHDLPRVWAPFVQVHEDGRRVANRPPLVLCPDCVEAGPPEWP